MESFAELAVRNWIQFCSNLRFISAGEDIRSGLQKNDAQLPYLCRAINPTSFCTDACAEAKRGVFVFEGHHKFQVESSIGSHIINTSIR
jgi:hypothetical protein